MNSTTVTNGIYSWQSCKQVIVNKPLIRDRFYRILFIGQNLNCIFVIYSFEKLLVFFWLALVDIFCLKFVFALACVYVSQRKRNNERKTNGNTFSLISNVDVKESIFFREELRILYKLYINFVNFMNTLLVFLLKLSFNYMAILYALAEVWP